MGMLDWFVPAGHLRCPIDGHPLETWQGKDGPCALLVRQEGVSHPVEHRVDAEVRWTTDELADSKALALPHSFIIYTYDCPRHQPVKARCLTRDGAWISTDILWPDPST